ncbi:N-6 DNA methylase [Rhizobium sp. WYJ-E13]|uniref:N-6 DNA methylase n=1 Tax=Rhizobium sp. WYJ-E13 TaxID=2849093 RepID=UPI001C1EE6A0|nr:N-6 DNA methylase [Rhizobium sp. WYJ-E13]QWW69360.1 N-6 DNA methylase [Rhizobium sp. WYJ-E13]
MASDQIHFDVEYNVDGKIVDFLTEMPLDVTPEERVRQRYLRILHYEYGYPKNLMKREVAVQHGSTQLTDVHGKIVRADIVIYRDASACAANNQGRIFLVVECKAPSIKDGYNQLVSYVFNTSAEGGVWFNGSGEDDEVAYFRRFSSPSSEFREWIGIPCYQEAWDALGRRKKVDLKKPKDIKGLLRRCHNRLHGRGNDSEEEDLTMDMVRLMLAKAMDEEGTDPLPKFYCTPEEYASETGIAAVKARIGELFEDVKRSNRDVFSEHERVTVGARAIADVVVELQDYSLLSGSGAAHEWDLMGHAYEQYASVYLKREKGQFFTNRLVVDLMVSMINPDYMDVILDPAGGSGGFLTGAMRYVRNKIVESEGSEIAKQRQLERHRKNLFLVEASRRLVKVAKTAMILNGDGHAGMTAGDSLGAYEGFDKTIVSQAGEGLPTVILTNPPFAGVGEGRITHEDVLRRFEAGKRWTDIDGAYQRTDELAPEGVPPELLFFERCVDWLKPGGRLGIVLPKSFLDTQTYRPGRTILFDRCRLLAVINCHKNTFQPFTGVRTCIIILQKLKPSEKSNANYPIFMAISRKVGQDSEGIPIYKKDAQNNVTEEVDHDLAEIGRAFEEFQHGKLKSSGYTFSVDRSKIDKNLNINPQMFLPHLNETLESVQAIDGKEGWSVSTIGDIAAGVKIFKGPRFKSESIIVDEPGPTVEPYLTPTAVLQEKSDSAKLLDVGRASAAQLRAINAIRVRRGDIVITRSGTIGRVAYITQRNHNAIVSDDLIRVRVEDESLRFYIFAYLQSKFAQDQMLRNEYGAVQQHLEPEHVRNILIPVAEDRSRLNETIDSVRRAIQVREQLEARNAGVSQAIEGLMNDAIAKKEDES